MSKPTPGPWEVEFVTIGASPPMGFGIWPVGRRAVDPNTKGPQDVLSAITSANMYEHWAFTGSYDVGTIEANARLIAAAPALLAALEQIANADSNQSPLNVTACYEAMKAIAQAALSAASGRAPTNKEE